MTTPRLHRPYYRNGQDHRSGADVGFNDIVTVFGFNGAKVGRWVTKQEQQIAANLLFDSLCDLQDILAVPSQVISLNGSLSLAFGTGGQRATCAHYDSQRQLLALAKNAGGGSLAHEWWHAYDHYITRHLWPRSGRRQFASSTWLEQKSALTHPLNQRLGKFFANTFLQADGKTASAYLTRAVAIDKQLNQFYYAQPEELTARAFEASIQSHSIKNHFLVKGTKQSTEAKLGIYPSDDYLQSLSQLIFDYFYWLGKALDHQQS